MKQVQGDVHENISHLNDLLQSVPDSSIDLLLLPEMWTTGFMTSTKALGADDILESFEIGQEAMIQIAKEKRCAVYGSLIEPVEDERLSNTGLFVSPEGVIATYRKRHLFGPGGERKHFVGGDKCVQVEWQGWRIRLTICYDLRFPVWQRQNPSMSDQYDILLNCANWPDVRIDAWEILLKARAVENQCYVLASNRTGDGPKGLKYPGFSLVLGPKGEELAHGKNGEECVIRTTLDSESLITFRENFPVLQEIDDFIISNL